MALFGRCISPFALTLILGGGALVLGCETNEPKTALNYTEDAKRAYDNAYEEFEAHNWIESQTLFREVKKKFSYSRYARLAELRIADADFEQEKYAEAIREYRQFVHDHRSETEEISYARSRIAEAQFKEVTDSFLLPSSDERDQAAIMDAYKELRGYLHDYPEARESDRMRDLLADVTARLIRHELSVARFYLDRDNYDATVERIQYALRTYTGIDEPSDSRASSRPANAKRSERLEPEALLLLGETYLKMRKSAEARQAFVTILRTYANSPLVVQAQRYVARLDQAR